MFCSDRTTTTTAIYLKLVISPLKLEWGQMRQISNQGAGKRPRQCCHPKGGNGAEGPKGPRTKGTATRGPEGPESGQNMRVRGPEGSEDEQS